jgi:hypothetical protein
MSACWSSYVPVTKLYTDSNHTDMLLNRIYACIHITSLTKTPLHLSIVGQSSSSQRLQKLPFPALMRRVSNLASPAGARPPSPACWAWAYANIHKPFVFASENR